MSNSKSEKIKGFLRYSLAHHPICWQYREHLIRIRGWSLCLGCTGFYSGLFLGFLLILLGLLDNIKWFGLVLLAILLYLPTLFRLANIKGFITTKRYLRILFRELLGIGIAVGIFSIWRAPSFEIQVLQVLIGISFYAFITFKRIKSGSKEWDDLCATCTFDRNAKCPGMEPLFTWRK